MPQFLFDTDHLTLFEKGHSPIGQRLSHLPREAVGVSAVTVEESLRGRLGYLARHSSGPLAIQGYADLIQTINLWHTLPIIAFDRLSDSQFQLLRAMKIRVGTQDLKIAAVALVNNLTLLTRNRRDFARIPGLAIADWSV